jgi:hypothetical protein
MEILWKKVGPVVECLTTDPKDMGSNPGGSEIGNKQHTGHEYLYTEEANFMPRVA